MENTPIKVQVILGSTRKGRWGDKPAHWIMSVLKDTPGVEAELVDLREWNLPLFDESTSPSQGNYQNPLQIKWAASVAKADAYVFIVAEYNHGYTAALKNALDYVYAEWNNKPVACIGYGSAMGARAIEQLREVAVELQMAPMRSAVHLPWEIMAATMKMEAPVDPSLFAAYKERADGMIKQLMWWARALKVARAEK